MKRSFGLGFFYFYSLYILIKIPLYYLSPAQVADYNTIDLVWQVETNVGGTVKQFFHSQGAGYCSL